MSQANAENKYILELMKRSPEIEDFCSKKSWFEIYTIFVINEVVTSWTRIEGRSRWKKRPLNKLGAGRVRKGLP